MICEGDGSYTSKDKVLGDFVRERLDRDEQDVGGANPINVSDILEGASRSVTSPVLEHPRGGSVGRRERFHL
jgi:hypothetical protein